MKADIIVSKWQALAGIRGVNELNVKKV